MRKLLTAIVLLLTTTMANAQEPDEQPFKASLYNKEYDLNFTINFHDEDVVIPWQDLFGPLPGFLARNGNNFCWIVTEAEINGKKAELEITNDYGSEDLTATLTQQNDTLYVLKQKSGSTMKVPVNGKWQKLPSTLNFVKRKRR